MKWHEKIERIAILTEAIVNMTIAPSKNLSGSDQARLIQEKRAEAIQLRGLHCRKDKE